MGIKISCRPPGTTAHCASAELIRRARPASSNARPPRRRHTDGVTLFESVAATAAERTTAMAGDDLIPSPDAVMDRAFTLPAPPDVVWPWLVQLGKCRAGWYLPSSVERFIPRSHRAIRAVDQQWQQLQVDEVVPDYGGRDAYFEVALIEPPRRLVYRSHRGRMQISWSISLEAPNTGSSATRVRLRLRLGP